jgi:hypothetical protein
VFLLLDVRGDATNDPDSANAVRSQSAPNAALPLSALNFLPFRTVSVRTTLTVFLYFFMSFLIVMVAQGHLGIYPVVLGVVAPIQLVLIVTSALKANP